MSSLDDSATMRILDFLTFQELSVSVAGVCRRLRRLCPRMQRRITAPSIDRIPGSGICSTLAVVPHAAAVRRLVVRFSWMAQGSGGETMAGLRVVRNGVEVCSYRFGNRTAPAQMETVCDEVPLKILNQIERQDRVVIWFIVGGEHGRTFTIRNFIGYCGELPEGSTKGLASKLPTLQKSLQYRGESNKQSSTLLSLADSVLYQVLSFLDFRDISSGAARVCVRLHSLCPRVQPPFRAADVMRAHGEHGADPSRVFAVLPMYDAPVARMAVRCFWWDQGWGNRKGCIGVGILRGGVEVYRYALNRAPAPHDWDYFYAEVPLPVLLEMQQGDQLVLWFIVGGGGGHQLNTRDLHVYMGTGPLSARVGSTGALPPAAPRHG